MICTVKIYGKLLQCTVNFTITVLSNELWHRFIIFRLILDYFPYFEKKKGFCDNHAACVLPPSTFEWLNHYETWYVHHGTCARLNGVLHESFPISLCVYICIPLLLLGSGSIKCYRGHECTCNDSRIEE
jgi:hypothetical protein